MTEYAFHFDASRCVGCKACQVACKDKNNTPRGVNYRRVYEYGGGLATTDDRGVISNNVFAYYASLGCNHCSDPACVKACPTGAHYKSKNGTVLIDSSMCIGCSRCARACPYDAPQLNVTTGVMQKCDRCQDRVEKGQLPSCAAACNNFALDFGTVDEIKSKYPNAVYEGIAPLPSHEVTRPGLYITKSRLTKPPGDMIGMVLNPKEV